ncbi:MAG: tetratricopeptide repeat protein [Bacteroidales bacterium]|nr:tetratricopeptide repeat protein [Bacteroidales bacterium]
MEKLYQNIEDYLDGNLPDENLNDLINLKKNNDLVNREIQLRKEVNLAIQDSGMMDLREKLEMQHKRHVSNYSFIHISRDLVKSWHLAAASFSLILVVGGLWYILSNKPYSTEKLVTKYYKPAHPILQVRSVDFNSDDALKEAFNYYRQNDYINALKYFNSLENQITARFYSGICYIELEKFSKAIEAFEYVINDKDNLFVEQADWYLGLIYLMNNQKSNAITQFEKISTSKSYYAKQAVDILKYLK